MTSIQRRYMKKINVLQILINYNYPLCGYTIRSQEIVKAIKPFAQSIIITNQDDGNPAVVRDIKGVKVYRPFLSPVRLGKIPFLGYFLDQPIFNKKIIKRVFAENQIDLLHAHTPHDISLPAIKMAQKSGIKTIYEVRGVWEETKKITGKKGGKKFEEMRDIETETMKKADKVIAISENLKKEIISRGIKKSKVAVVPNGVNIKDFSRIKKDVSLAKKLRIKDKTIIGYIGTIRKLEGLQVAIKAMKKIIKDNPEIVLLIVGDGEYLSDLKQLVKKLNLQKHVIFTGEIAHSKITSYYSLIDICIYPRIDARVCHLVTPLKPLEAMAMGKFVLASDVGGLKEMVIPGVSGELFRADNELDFVEKILYYSRYPQKRERIAGCGREWVRKNRDWQKLAKLYKKIYQELINK